MTEINSDQLQRRNYMGYAPANLPQTINGNNNPQDETIRLEYLSSIYAHPGRDPQKIWGRIKS
jgi:hypothetical protein